MALPPEIYDDLVHVRPTVCQDGGSTLIMVRPADDVEGKRRLIRSRWSVERGKWLIQAQTAPRGCAGYPRAAIAMPWRGPPESVFAAFARPKCRPLGRLHDVAVDFGLLLASWTSSSVAPPSCRADVFPDRHVEQHVFLEHDRHAPAPATTRVTLMMSTRRWPTGPSPAE